MSQLWEIDTIHRTSSSPSSDIEKLVNAFNTLRSNSSGSSEPINPTAYMWWMDTSTGLIKQRNASNSSWLVQGNISEERVMTMSSTQTVTPQDYGKTYLADASANSLTLNLLSAAALGKGFYCTVKKIDSSANSVTLIPAGTETIEGNATFRLLAQESIRLVSDGANWWIVQAHLIDRINADLLATNTVPLQLTTGNVVTLNGTTTINALGNAPEGLRRLLRFSNSLTLTHSPSLLLPGGRNIITQAGDCAEVLSLGNNSWLCSYFTRASGKTIVPNGAFYAYNSPASSFAHTVMTKVALQNKRFDYTGWFNTSSSRYTPLIPGQYLFGAAIKFQNADNACKVVSSIYKNGSEYANAESRTPGANVEVQPMVSALVDINGSSDFVEFYALQDGGGIENNVVGASKTYLWGYLLSAPA